MRRLLLLRHAKAAPIQGRDDHARSLTEVGRSDARGIAEAVAKTAMCPQFVLYSSATRTRETAEIVASLWPRRPALVAEPALYEATRSTLLNLARGLPDNATVAMIVGHNPGIGELANALAGAGVDADRLRMAAKYPTSGLAILDFPAERWEEIATRGGRLAAFVTPAELGGGRE
jgi:phosphohistidine phosphatase